MHCIGTITNPKLGTDVSFYRADFSEAYIKSVIRGNPSGNVVAFKYLFILLKLLLNLPGQ